MEPPDPGGSVPPAACFVTVSNESGMDTDGSFTVSSRPIKRSRSRRMCKQCNKHKKNGANSIHKGSDCHCSDNDVEKLLSNFATPTTPQIQHDKPGTSSTSTTQKPNFSPVGRSQYEATDCAPYVIHVVKVVSSPDDGVILHPIAFGRVLKKHGIYNIVNGSLKKIGRNRMSVSFNNYSDANAFLVENILSKENMKAFIPTFNVTRMGLVRGIPTELSDEEILENISVPIGCGKILKIRRLNFKVNVDGSPTWKPSQTVVLTFDGQILPKRIFMCYNSLTVQLYTYPTVQCYSCCRFGHTKAQCRSKPRCYKCGQGHTGDTCKIEEDNAQCCLCNGTHYATNKACPEYNRQTSIKTSMAENCISYAEASKLHPPIYKSYSEMVKLTKQQEPKNVHYSITHPNVSTSYTKTVYSKPRSPYIAPKGYNKVAHSELTKDYNMPLPTNGCALINKSNQEQISQQSLTQIIAALIITLSQNNISLPSTVAPLLNALNLNILNNNYGQSSQDSPVELS